MLISIIWRIVRSCFRIIFWKCLAHWYLGLVKKNSETKTPSILGLCQVSRPLLPQFDGFKLYKTSSVPGPRPWLYIRTSSSDYLRGLGTHHPNRSYWYLRTTDTKIEQLPSEARNTCWWYVAVCVHEIWNLSTKEGSLFVLFFFFFFWDLPKRSAFYNLCSWVLSFFQACYEPVCCTNCVVRSGNLYDLVLRFPQDFSCCLLINFVGTFLTTSWPLLYK